jgi:hypothetical protein
MALDVDVENLNREIEHDFEMRDALMVDEAKTFGSFY